nr:MAG TPA: hypothetical protein [Bacteriophage sp.]
MFPACLEDKRCREASSLRASLIWEGIVEFLITFSASRIFFSISEKLMLSVLLRPVTSLICLPIRAKVL